MSIEPFRASDLSEIDVQAAQRSIGPYIDRLGQEYETGGPAYTMRCRGRVVACAGFLWTTRGAHLWAVLAERAPLLALHRMALRAFSVYPEVRVTATVETDFPAGCRWLEMLGFERADRWPQCGPDGRDHYVYVREAHT